MRAPFGIGSLHLVHYLLVHAAPHMCSPFCIPLVRTRTWPHWTRRRKDVPHKYCTAKLWVTLLANQPPLYAPGRPLITHRALPFQILQKLIRLLIGGGSSTVAINTHSVILRKISKNASFCQCGGFDAMLRFFLSSIRTCTLTSAQANSEVNREIYAYLF